MYLPLSSYDIEKALQQLNNPESKTRRFLKERSLDLQKIIASIVFDIKERENLEDVILQRIYKGLNRIADTEQSGNLYAWKDRTVFELERIKEYRESFKDIQRLRHLLRQYILSFQETKRQLYFVQQVTPSEQTIAALKPVFKEGADLLQLEHTIKTVEGILLHPPQQQDVEGEFILGNIVYDDKEIHPLRITRSALNRHILILGESGIGKTNLSYFLLLQIMQQIPCMIFDFKRDYRHLSSHRNAHIIRWNQLQFNPLQQPPGVPQLEWMQAFVDVFSQDNALLLGAKGFLLEQLDYLYRQFKNECPSLRHLLQLLNTLKISPGKREASYLAVCRNRLKTLAIELSNIVNCRVGKTVEQSLSQNVIIELDGLGVESQNLLINLVLTWIYLYRMARGERGALQHIIVFDEAKRIFDVNKEKRPIEGIPNIDILTSRVREFGEGLIVADQEWSKLTDSIKANSFVKVLFRLGSGKDMEDAARSIGLERKEFIGRLRTGEAIVKLGNLKPCLIKTPLASIQKQSPADFTQKPRFQPENDPISPISLSDKLTEIEKRFLDDVHQFPLSPLTQRYDRLQINPRQGNKLKQKLIETGFIKEAPIIDGRKVVLLELTSKAAITLNQNPKKGWRKGGVEHQYWCNRISEYYKSKGYPVEEEVSIGEGKAVDLVAEGEGKKIAIEVETGKSDTKENIESCLAAGFHKIIIAATREETKAKIVEKAMNIEGNSVSKVEVVCCSDISKDTTVDQRTSKK